MSINEAINLAAKEQKEGNLENAEEIYRIVLTSDPSNAVANHNLGLIFMSKMQSVIANRYFKVAIESGSDESQYYCSYINGLLNSHDLRNARLAIENAKNSGISDSEISSFERRLLSPSECAARGIIFKAQDHHYIDVLSQLHTKKYAAYFEIGAKTGDSLRLSISPSVAIDPYFKLRNDPVGEKDFCLLFQETSDQFFKGSLPLLAGISCEFGFIDGMHLFEYALQDFINLAKIATDNSLMVFHDVLPSSFDASTRDFKKIPKGGAWMGDTWKLIPILIESGLTNNLRVLTSAPSGLLTVFQPSKAIIANLEKNFEGLCQSWREITLEDYGLSTLYAFDVYQKPEQFLNYIRKTRFGTDIGDEKKQWVSH